MIVLLLSEQGRTAKEWHKSPKSHTHKRGHEFTCTKLRIFCLTNINNPKFMSFWLIIFWLYNNGKAICAFSRTCTLDFELWSFPGLGRCNAILHDAGRGSQPQLPASAASQPHDHEDVQPTHLQPSCTHIAILVFTFITVFNTSHEIFNILV